MAERPALTSPAAVGIWLVSLVGSWAMGLAVLGSISDAVFGCRQDPTSPAADVGGVGGWVILAAASIVPVVVMIAVAPVARRAGLIGLAVVVAGVGLVTANAWIGPCL